ncbi:hypothetical protein [Zunongwangia pacifica]|uniref:Polymer-forming cytoskeletal protein n=1 Tax=Zunongwangia pacifica TaxID=2911062 RepID=A0A9X1ZT82_9FLAO|nr:hypothetical protein [Zunongwangia pacifica]MCL6220597.1 hypothetical protein [Zunongwangia pacifica]
MSFKKAYLTIRLNANALYVVLIIGVLVAILLGSFLLLAHHQRLFQLKSFNTSKNISALHQAFFTYPESKDGLKNTSDYWGAFRKVQIEDEDHQLVKAALLCGKKDSVYPSLYLEDHHSPLVLAGKSSLEGRLELPDGYWKPGAVNGRYFSGTTTIKRINPSAEMPPINFEWRRYVEGLLQGNNVESKKLNLVRNQLNNSFLEPVNLIQSHGGIFLQAELIGNIIVRDDVGIKVSANSKLQDIVLVAPHITIEKGFKGTIHCIANHIEIENNVLLNYPSSLVVIEDEEKTAINDGIYTDIIIGENTLLSGFVVFLNNNSNLYDNRNVDISLGTNSRLVGDVYSQGYLELKGEVIGSIYTSYFMYASDRGGKYINYLYDSRISLNELKTHYIGSLPLQRTTDYIVASWLY